MVLSEASYLMQVAVSDNQIHGKLLIIICWKLLGHNPNENWNFHKHIELDSFRLDREHSFDPGADI